MAPAVFSLSPQREFIGFGKVASRGSAAQSRSTSAGSAPSDGQASQELQRSLEESPQQNSFSQVYRAGTLELPDYDYPTPWSISQLPGGDFAAPLIVKNTFIGFDALRTPSFEEFYEERKVKSCPASGIGLPPGLEEEATAGDTALPAEHLLPAGLLDNEFETQQFLPPPPQQPPRLDGYWQSPMLPVPFHAPQQPVVLDLQSALGSPFEVVEPLAPEPELGSAERPTLGSRGHWFGACKPCAFLYTKGCSNGIMCQFCHLCDDGEKKRRAKDKRAAFRSTRHGGC